MTSSTPRLFVCQPYWLCQNLLLSFLVFLLAKLIVAGSDSDSGVGSHAHIPPAAGILRLPPKSLLVANNPSAV